MKDDIEIFVRSQDEIDGDDSDVFGILDSKAQLEIDKYISGLEDIKIEEVIKDLKKTKNDKVHKQ